ncbi:MAG: hypothetical protein K9I29_09460 [Bacteroidales bacterium]|nr:hypothetical protein [Bacteroidales bacterium]MCF8328505.1 hypothetical protein [Bacteroidales bacterium]
MEKTTILGLYITDRVKEALEVQNILTRYGCSIKTRLGLHEVVNDYCSRSGLILLELTGPQEDRDNLQKELKQIDELQIQKMEFDD